MTASTHPTVNCDFWSENPEAMAREHLAHSNVEITIAANFFETTQKSIEAIVPVFAGDVTKIEFVSAWLPDRSASGGERRHHGAFLFDKDNWPLVFVRGALLGEESFTGKQTAKRICEILGVQDEDFRRIDTAAYGKNSRYAIVVRIIP